MLRKLIGPFVAVLVLSLVAWGLSAWRPGPSLSRIAPQEETLGSSTPEESPSPTPAPLTSTPSATSTPRLLPPERPPAGAERQFRTDFSVHSVPYSEILSGGPPKDGIPALYNFSDEL